MSKKQNSAEGAGNAKELPGGAGVDASSDMGAIIADDAQGAAAAMSEVPRGVTVKARVLVACGYGEPNDVVELDVEQATAMVGVVDTDPAAVEYAESLQEP